MITGGARGQGAAEGKLFRAEGAEVYLTDVLVDEGLETAAEIGATFIEHDVTDSDAWSAVVKRIESEHAHLDVLINNAGIFHMMGMADTERALWDRTIAINQTGVFLGLQAVAAIMTRQKSGSIINISSIAGLRGAGGAFAYGASKWAVRGMTKSAAQELSPHGIRVNSVAPGIITTDIWEESRRTIPGLIENMEAGVSLRRWGESQDVADVVLFLASDLASYVTGETITVDGGMAKVRGGGKPEFKE